MTSAEEYLGEILELDSQMRELQLKINELAREATNSDDYEEFFDSIESYIKL